MTGEIFVIAEQKRGIIEPGSLELAAFARELAEAAGLVPVGLILGYPVTTLSEQWAAETGFQVLGLENENFNFYNGEAYVNALAEVISERKPKYVLVSHTATGFDFAPRLAARLKCSCSTGITAVASPPVGDRNGQAQGLTLPRATGFKPDKGIKFVRSICGGKIVTEVEPVPDTIAIITVMPGASKPARAPGRGAVEIIKVKLEPLFTRALGYIVAKRGALDLTKAEVIVSAGRGIGEPEKLELVRQLAALFPKSALGASRPVVDAGWLPLEHQVGQTGSTVRPKLYIAVGISGAVQHAAGMSGSDLVVAINTDRNANIFRIASIGIVKDLNEFLPVLIERIKGQLPLP